MIRQQDSAVTEVFAAQSDTNEESGYRYVLDDRAGFIEDDKEILNLMKEMTQYCNVAVVTTRSHSYYSTEKAMQWLCLNRILAMARHLQMYRCITQASTM